jgi:hypothetical protein
MKKILSAFVVLIAFSAMAQTDSSEIEMNSVDIVFVKLPAVTAIGGADGKPVSKEIGPAGGTIISDDRRIELIFPQGALTTKTAVSIQPIVNLIPNGNGKAYQFEPSGIQFQKPVQVVFHYTDEEAGICPPQLKFMALQDHAGKWEYMNYDEWDSAGRSLKGFISHFSALLDGNLMDLSPNEKTLKVGESFSLSLNVVEPPGGDELPALPSNGKRKIKWFVKGGERVGTLSPGPGKYNATYKAPDYLGKSDPQVILKIDELTIREVVQRTKHKKGYWTGTTRVPEIKNLATFTCNINLYDEYKISVIYQGGCGLRCGAEIDDRSFFQARLYPNKVEITDVINSEPTLTKRPNCQSETRGGRSAEYTLTYDPTGCQGPAHVVSGRLAGYGTLIDDRTIAPPDITIQFAPNIVKIMIGTVHMPGTPGASTNKAYLHRQKVIPAQKGYDEPPEPEEDVTVGNKIKFKANRQRQDFIVSDDGPYSYQLIIEPL